MIRMLAIAGPTGRPFTATLSGTAAAELALVFPGLSYGAGRPLLARAAAEARARGADIARLDLAYEGDDAFLARPGAEVIAEIEADGRAVMAEVAAAGGWERLTLIGKSLGTIAMGGILAAHLPLPCRLVWLTPSLQGTGLAARASRPIPGFSLIGSRDASAALARGADWAGRPAITHLELPGFDHGWQHEAGAVATEAGLAQAMQALGDWLDKGIFR